jgi:hypothetical protein
VLNKLHRPFVAHLIEGNYDTLPISSTSPKKSLSSAFVIRLKASPSLYGQRCNAKGEPFWFWSCPMAVNL